MPFITQVRQKPATTDIRQDTADGLNPTIRRRGFDLRHRRTGATSQNLRKSSHLRTLRLALPTPRDKAIKGGDVVDGVAEIRIVDQAALIDVDR